MALTEVQQIQEIIKKSNHILITFPKEFSIDAVASALALYLFLRKKNKLVDIISSGFELPKNLKFMPKSNLIKPKISSLQKFIISLDINSDKIDEFSYNLEEDKLKIYIVPKSGSLEKKDIVAENSSYKYDLIFSVDTPDLNSLGQNFENFPEFFYNTTIINIDHKAENEHFGQINLININSVATTEILFRLINTIDKDLIDKNIATCLLTGLISKTKSFKTPNVTPVTLEIASQLMALEADREIIIKNLYRSRTLSTLNLWGRVLARLKSEGGNKLVWSILTENDFIEAQSNQKDLDDIIEELISFVPGVEIVVLIYQLNGQICVLVNTLKNHNAMYLTSTFNPVGSKNMAEFCLTEKNLLEAEKEVIGKIKERLTKQV